MDTPEKLSIRKGCDRVPVYRDRDNRFTQSCTRRFRDEVENRLYIITYSLYGKTRRELCVNILSLLFLS